MTDMTAFERRVADGMLHRAGPVRPVDDLAIFEAIDTRSQGWGPWRTLRHLRRRARPAPVISDHEQQPTAIPTTIIGRTHAMSSPVKTIVAGVLVFAIGGMLLIAQPFGQQEGTVPGAPRPPVPSAGCGSSTVESGQHPDNALEVDGLERTWAMYVPEAHDGLTPAPLWLHFHGGTEVASPNDVLRVAVEEGFVVVAPQGIRTQMGLPRTWMFGEDDTAIDLSAANPDIALVDALIDEIGAQLCIDLARVYAAGWSSGGQASSVVACVLDERIAAVAPVAGAGLIDLGAACEAERAVPHLSVVGTGDAWFEGLDQGDPWGEHPIARTLMSDHHVDRTAAVALRHGCEPEPVVELVEDGVERLTWSCPPGADVELVVIEGGPHSWQPAWQPVGDWYDTSEAVWEFFEQHPLPE